MDVKKLIVTNLPHYSSNATIRLDFATRRSDGDVTFQRDFALSRHNRQLWDAYMDENHLIGGEVHIFINLKGLDISK